uniref:hypothetical protein n=1 Tax=Herbidospora sakaeratensis TaxID=564415 RepID=UPI000782B66A|nr:hypothetical protein [Herbidospora sakaeratensis]
MTQWAETFDYYRALLEAEEWLSSAMCWTVVEGDHSLAETATRLTGHPNVGDPRRVGDLLGGPLTVSIGRTPSEVVLFEPGGFLSSHPPVLIRLSRDCNVYSVFWDIDGNNYLSRASGGRILARLDLTEPEEWPAEGVDTWPELRHFNHADEDDWQAAGLAVAELSTGRRFSREWLQEPHRFIQVSWPLPDENTAPPASGQEPGFDTKARLVEALIADFDFGGFPAAHEALTLLRAGTHAPDDLMTRVRELDQVMVADFRAHDEGEMEDNPRWRRMQAAFALSMAVEEPGIRPPGFGVFNHAENAYGDRWPEMRRRLIDR